MEHLYITAFRFDNRFDNRCGKPAMRSPISPLNPEDPGWDCIVRLVVLPVSAAETATTNDGRV